MSISLALYDTPKAQLKQTLETLGKALETFPKEHLRLLLIDNRSKRHEVHKITRWRDIQTEIIAGFGNVGFGRAHNLALEKNRLGHFHLILNPDVWIQKDALQNGLNFLSEHSEIGLCAPAILEANHQLTHLGRDFPDIFSLGLRGFAPKGLKKLFANYLDRYTLADTLPTLNTGKVLWNLPCFSGSFLLMRGEIFKQLKGFDPQFFLYFEDFDFSLRARKITKTALLPQMQIQHFGGNTSRKGLKHCYHFIRSAFQFYQKNGWRFFQR